MKRNNINWKSAYIYWELGKMCKNLGNAWNQRELKWASGPLTFNPNMIGSTAIKSYKLCLLTYKTFQIQQPTYLYESLSFPSHSLSTRSSDSSVLSIPYVRTSLGKRAFSVIAPRLWNSLPPDTHNSLSVSTFRSKLKTHLFKLAFPPWILSHPIIGLPTRIWLRLIFLYF